jgi:hypothetical protein
VGGLAGSRHEIDRAANAYDRGPQEASELLVKSPTARRL